MIALSRSPLTVVLAALVANLGCGPTVSTPTAPDSETVWDVIYMNQQAVGHQSLTLRSLTEGQQLLRDAEATSVLNVQRFGQSTRETMQLASRESDEGEVISVEATMHSGSGAIRTAGRRAGNVLQLETHAGGQIQRWSLTLPPQCGGYFAVEWSLRTDPMQPGEQRTLHALLPVLNQIAEITLTAGERRRVELLDETRNLLRIDQQLQLPDGNRIDVVAWTTDDGEVIKSEVTSLQQVTYRVEREQALASTQRARFDLGKFSTVPLAEPLRVTEATRQIRYLVTLQGDDPTKFFPTTPGQLVVSRDAHSAVVTVQSLRPGEDPADGAEDQPQDADREPSTMIQSDDRLIRDLAAQIRPAGSDTWSRAVATERFVLENVTAKNLSTAFATAAEVAKSRQGDCTEHAVLTAALCRAQGVPARVLIGLVYASEQQGFAFHMWNEVWVDNRWLPLDATVGRGGTGPEYLVVARSNLATGDTFGALLPVMKVMGQLSIKVLDVVDEPGQPENSATRP